MYRTKHYCALSLLCLVVLIVGAATGQASRTGGFVYTISNPDGPNAIAAYWQDPASGKLTYFGSYPTGGLGAPTGDVVGTEQNALVAEGDFLYAVNPGSNDISVFAIHSNGELRLIHAPFPSGGITPVSLAIHDHWLYVANLGDSVTPPNYTGFRVDDGMLQPMENSAVTMSIGDHPSDLIFNREGSLLVGSRGIGNIVDVFSVADDGYLNRAALLGNQPGVLGLAFNPSDPTVVLAGLTFLPGPAAYKISANGSISLTDSVIDSAAMDTCWEVIERTGRRAWFSSPASSFITLYSIADNGFLTRISAHDTTAFGDSTTDMVFSPSEHFLYVLKPLSNGIEALQLTGDQADAGLADVAVVEIPGSAFSATGLVFVNSKTQ